jgi:hypothetical protein
MKLEQVYDKEDKMSSEAAWEAGLSPAGVGFSSPCLKDRGLQARSSKRISDEKLAEVTENLLDERRRVGGDTACIKGVASITDIFVELREARAQIREWQQDYEQLVQVAEMYVDAFGEDEMLTLLEAMRLTAVRDAIAHWRKKQEPVKHEEAL